MTVRGLAIRSVSALHLCAGAALTARPEPIVDRLAGRAEQAVPAWVARVLGIRMLVQGMVEIVRPDLSSAGALVDAAHAASMVPAAARWRQYRRSALVSGLGALGCAALVATAGPSVRAEGAR